MEKEKFISKLNIKDYNNQLEKILSKKTFSEDTKNLLLSMLYKIENAYDDYNRVNGDTKTKREILEEILEIIEKDCDTIEIIKEKNSKSILEEKKIVTYLNAREMLYEIYQIKQNRFEVPDEYEIIKPALEETLNKGYSIFSNEVIRDFDGWSWHITVEEIENLTINLLYQTIKILVGHEFLDSWQNSKDVDYITKLIDILEQKYKTDLAGKLFKTIAQLSILSFIQNNEKERKRLIKIQEELQKEFNELDDKTAYITSLGKKKKKIVEEISKIDKTINNDRKLKNEFIARNELLDMNHRIFSLSDFVEVLEKEREDLIKKLNTYSKKMEPLNFIKTKTEIETKLTLIKEIDLLKRDKKIYNQKVKELLGLVYEAIRIQINNIEEKETLINLIYKMRYYSLIYVTENEQVYNIVDVNPFQKLVITKACKLKIITIFSKNIKENYEIIKSILQTDIIELEKIYFKFIQKENKIILEIYDEDNIYKTLEFSTIEELNVKLNKKIKVFI